MLPPNLRRKNNFSPGSHLRRTEELMTEVDWSQLPKELLQLISEKLSNTEIYLIRFRSVCSTWRRSSSIPRHPHNYSSLKLPMFPDSENFDSCISKQNIFLIKPPNQKTHLRPWLIRIGPNINGKTQLWHPLDLNQTSPSCFPYPYDVLDFNKLSVLQLRQTFYMHHHDLRPNRSYQAIHFERVVVATSEGGQPLALLTYNYQSMPIIFHCGDDSWKDIPAMSMPGYGDICVFKGRLCATDGDGRTVMIRPDSIVHLPANPMFTIGGADKLLVESECELLLVDAYGFAFDDDDHVRIDVFRLDEKEMKWVKLTDLGDRVLFLGGDRSFCVSASDLCVANGNCVVYSRRYAYHLNATEFGKQMRIFHLDQGRVSPLSDYPDYFKLFWPPPEWILGMHS